MGLVSRLQLLSETPLSSEYGAYKTANAIYKTVTATHKTVKATYKTVKAPYNTVKATYKTVKATYKTVKAEIFFELFIDWWWPFWNKGPSPPLYFSHA